MLTGMLSPTGTIALVVGTVLAIMYGWEAMPYTWRRWVVGIGFLLIVIAAILGGNAPDFDAY